jgi:hypothetical protein
MTVADPENVRLGEQGVAREVRGSDRGALASPAGGDSGEVERPERLPEAPPGPSWETFDDHRFEADDPLHCADCGVHVLALPRRRCGGS